jgi:hypothetical protein
MFQKLGIKTKFKSFFFYKVGGMYSYMNDKKEVS